MPTSEPTRQRAAVEDVEIGLVLAPVLRVEANLVNVEAVGVLHGELAHPDQAGPRPRVVTELDLDLVHQPRQVTVGVDLALAQVRDHFLVSHGEHHVAVPAIGEPGQLGTDRVVAAGGLPYLARMDDRHQEFLAADRVHLFADDVLDLAQ